MNFETKNMKRYRLLTNPMGLTYKDICSLLSCGKTTAFKIINNIHKMVASKPGALLVTQGIVSREAFCEYFSWDFREIQKFAMQDLSALSQTLLNT